MGSQGSCQLGGVISTNAGGLNAVRYGVARDLVLGLEVVLPDGRVISRSRGLRKDNTGYRISDLFIGAEGTLGVITAATVKLFPLLPGRATALLHFADIAGATEGVVKLREDCDDNLVSYELITRESAALAASLPGVGPLNLDARADVMVLAEVAAREDHRATALLDQALAAMMDSGLVVDGIVATSARQRENMWRFRESIPEAEKLAGGSIKLDISVPVQLIPEFVDEARQSLAAYSGARLSIFGHLGDGNLHFNVLAPADDDAAEWKHHNENSISAAVMDLAESYGGSFSAEHGIGSLKRNDLARYRPAEELSLMRALKAVLDPVGIMNPGKLF
jgi:FAD/FMN-containing dehydrogenase